MILYHGSKIVIANPSTKGSNPTNDYGPSFYLTKDIEAAKSWACRNDSVGVVSKFLINDNEYSNLKILDLTNKEKYSVLNWLAILMHFRTLDSSFVRNNKIILDWLNKYYIDVNEYDVIIGFRADDSYFRFPIRFISNDLSFEDLEGVFISGHLGIQYAFMSEKAIKCLKYRGFVDCDASFLGHYYSIVEKATNEFDVLINKARDPNKTYILDLMRKDNAK